MTRVPPWAVSTCRGDGTFNNVGAKLFALRGERLSSTSLSHVAEQAIEPVICCWLLCQGKACGRRHQRTPSLVLHFNNGPAPLPTFAYSALHE